MKAVGIRKKGDNYEVTYKSGTKELVGKKSAERIKMQIAADRKKAPSVGRKLKPKGIGGVGRAKPKLKK